MLSGGNEAESLRSLPLVFKRRDDISLEKHAALERTAHLGLRRHRHQPPHRLTKLRDDQRLARSGDLIEQLQTLCLELPRVV